jgi:hypothetical protein
MTTKEMDILRHHLYVAGKNYYFEMAHQRLDEEEGEYYYAYEVMKDLVNDLLSEEPVNLSEILSGVDKTAKRHAKELARKYNVIVW